jgi:threonine aldolase
MKQGDMKFTPASAPPFIELRTDAFTQPTEEMIDVARSLGYMYSDLARECPQTDELEAYGAELLGKEAGILVPSGTLANLLGMLTLGKRGSEVIVEADSHIYNRERGGISAVAGLVPRPVRGKHGVLTPEDVMPYVRHDPTARTVNPNWQWSVLISRTSLFCIENPHNDAGNRVWTVEQTRALCDFAHSVGAGVHVDGARIFNSAMALDVPVKELAMPADTVAIGLAKGLAAPVGALFCASREIVEHARMLRQMLGGAMHRPAWLSAAGLIALKKMPAQFRVDHANARLLAEQMSGIPGIKIDLTQVQTNTVLFEVTDTRWTTESFVAALAERKIRIGSRGERRFRVMTHHSIGEAQIGIFVDELGQLMRKGQ